MTLVIGLRLSLLRSDWTSLLQVFAMAVDFQHEQYQQSSLGSLGGQEQAWNAGNTDMDVGGIVVMGNRGERSSETPQVSGAFASPASNFNGNYTLGGFLHGIDAWAQLLLHEMVRNWISVMKLVFANWLLLAHETSNFPFSKPPALRP